MEYKINDIVYDTGILKRYRGDIGIITDILIGRIESHKSYTIKWIYQKILDEHENYIGHINNYNEHEMTEYFKIITKEQMMIEML